MESLQLALVRCQRPNLIAAITPIQHLLEGDNYLYKGVI